MAWLRHETDRRTEATLGGAGAFTGAISLALGQAVLSGAPAAIGCGLAVGTIAASSGLVAFWWRVTPKVGDVDLSGMDSQQ